MPEAATQPELTPAERYVAAAGVSNTLSKVMEVLTTPTTSSHPASTACSPGTMGQNPSGRQTVSSKRCFPRIQSGRHTTGEYFSRRDSCCSSPRNRTS
jgi:hypothetical protein